MAGAQGCWGGGGEGGTALTPLFLLSFPPFAFLSFHIELFAVAPHPIQQQELILGVMILEGICRQLMGS